MRDTYYAKQFNGCEDPAHNGWWIVRPDGVAVAQVDGVDRNICERRCRAMVRLINRGIQAEARSQETKGEERDVHHRIK